MFRIETRSDDRHSLMNGVATVATVCEALALMPDADHGVVADDYAGELGDILADMPRHSRITVYGDSCEYIVESL